MPDRLLIDRKGTQYTGLYVSDTHFIVRVLNPLTEEQANKEALHTKDELTSPDKIKRSAEYEPIHFLIDGKYYTLLTEADILLDELRETEWVPSANIRVWIPIDITPNYNGTYSAGIAYNILPYSYNSKHVPEFEKYILKFQGSKDAIAHMMPLKRTDTFLTVPMQLAVSNASLMASNIEFTQTIDLVDSHDDTFWEDHEIKFAFDEATYIEAGETKELTIRATYMGEAMTDFNEKYILEAVDGYAPHKRAEFVNGVATVRVQALGLTNGEQMRVKLNSPFYTSLAEIVMDVI